VVEITVVGAGLRSPVEDMQRYVVRQSFRPIRSKLTSPRPISSSSTRQFCRSGGCARRRLMD